MELRSYQTAAIESARVARRLGHRRILLCAPTGAGKTVIATAIIQSALQYDQSVLVIAHRQELVNQFYVALQRLGITAGIMRGQDERTDPQARVQVGTIQTLTRRSLPKGDLVVVDECHRVPGDSYTRVLQEYPASTVFGLTATPCRLDGQPLREHFDCMVQVAPYSELIDSGSIVAPIVYAARKPPALSHVRKVAGDYNLGQLEDAVLEPHVIGDVVDAWHRNAAGRSTVLFAVGVQHSKELVESFRESGVRAAHLDGTTPDDERLQILTDLEVGKLKLVSNVGVLCEGWDQPRVKCCIMARPTLSLTLWMQCAGRILRPWQGVSPLILDHSGNVDLHGLPHEDREWSLDGTAQRKVEVRYRTCAKCYAYIKGSPCPVCGHEEIRESRTVRTSDGVMDRIDAALKKERSSDPKRAYFDDQAEKARKKGFKPGFAAALYKEKYGDWPPWAWSHALKSEHAKDSDWQDRIAKRERERAWWQEVNEKRKYENPEVAEEPHEPAGAFDDLL